MGTSSWLATWQDAEMIERAGIAIAPPIRMGSPVPPQRTGVQIAWELTRRLLIRYITPRQIGRFDAGSTYQCYATPTPYTPEEAIHYLLVPEADVPRTHAYLLDPARIPVIVGPIWVASAQGIQYILPAGFPADAIVVPGAPTGRWAIPVS